MKLFKKIPIAGYEKYEVNEDGYVLLPDGTLTSMNMNELIGGVRVGELISKLFSPENCKLAYS